MLIISKYHIRSVSDKPPVLKTKSDISDEENCSEKTSEK